MSIGLLGFPSCCDVKVSEIREAVSELEREVGFCLRGYVAGTTLVPKHLQLPVSNLASYLQDSLGLSSEGSYCL